MMNEGTKTAIRLLKEDIQLEKEASKAYMSWANRFEESYVKDFFLSFSRDEAGHAAGQSRLLSQRETGDYEVKLFCPQCGWILNFGREPTVGSIRMCPMCGAKSMLDQKEADFLLNVVNY